MENGDLHDVAHLEERLSVTVAFSQRAGSAEEMHLDLPIGATVLVALQRSGLLQRHPTIDPARHPVGVWGRLCGLDQPLRDRDRVELYRPLVIDPKEARRLRQRRQRDQRSDSGRR